MEYEVHFFHFICGSILLKPDAPFHDSSISSLFLNESDGIIINRVITISLLYRSTLNILATMSVAASSLRCLGYSFYAQFPYFIFVRQAEWPSLFLLLSRLHRGVKEWRAQAPVTWGLSAELFSGLETGMLEIRF